MLTSLSSKLKEAGISVKTTGDEDSTFSDLKERLPSDQSRYIVSDYVFDREGSHQERLICIVWVL